MARSATSTVGNVVSRENSTAPLASALRPAPAFNTANSHCTPWAQALRRAATHCPIELPVPVAAPAANAARALTRLRRSSTAAGSFSATTSLPRPYKRETSRASTTLAIPASRARAPCTASRLCQAARRRGKCGTSPPSSLVPAIATVSTPAPAGGTCCAQVAPAWAQVHRKRSKTQCPEPLTSRPLRPPCPTRHKGLKMIVSSWKVSLRAQHGLLSHHPWGPGGG